MLFLWRVRSSCQIALYNHDDHINCSDCRSGRFFVFLYDFSGLVSITYFLCNMHTCKQSLFRYVCSCYTHLLQAYLTSSCLFSCVVEVCWANAIQIHTNHICRIFSLIKDFLRQFYNHRNSLQFLSVRLSCCFHFYSLMSQMTMFADFL